jgi:serine/threonine-protein kinase
VQNKVAVTPERWRRIQELFDAAFEVEESERSSWLAARCGDDESLCADVLALLGSAEENTRLERELDRAVADAALEIDELQPGRKIGRYRIVRLLGRGGMGAVYLAERVEGEFEQQVALKLIGRALPGSALTRRFRAERQILAQLNHPNIARLLDGGASEDGVPYLAMEYVEGERIDGYCERHALDVRARLRLFQQVCAAIQYAHQNLVVHRDIKPSNILVTAEGAPKLLDFGIAKLLDAERGTTTAGDGLTRLHERVLTPEHASPEQVRGEPIGTASDVYALGVLLYELLTGARPYAVLGRSMEELERIICTVQPPRPSAAVARRGDAAARPLARTLAGDLDNIALKAMHKEPARRYVSAAALAEDIQNYLDQRPVQARPDAWTYRAQKFLRRNALLVSAAASMSLLIATLTVFYTTRLAAERDRAAFEAQKSRQVARFLTDVFRVADPKEAQGRQITALELLDRGARDIDARLADQPLVRAELLAAIGLTYKNLSAYERAGPLLEESLAIRAKAGQEYTREYALTLYELANLRRFEARFAESEQQFARALEIQEALFTGPHEDKAATLTHFAQLYYEMHRPQPSYEMQRRALDMTLALFGERHAASADRMNNLGLVLQALDRHREAEAHLRKSVEIRTAVQGARHPETLIARYNLALLLRSTGRYRRAEEILREITPVRRQVLGAGHPSVGYTLTALGGVQTSLGRYAEAEATLKEALDLLTAKLGPTHWRVGAVWRSLGLLDLERGAYASARERFERAHAIESKAFGDDSTAAHKTRTLVALALLAQGDTRSAAPLLETAYAGLMERGAAEHSDSARTLEALGAVRLHQQRLAEAEAFLQRALAIHARTGRGDSQDASRIQLALADAALVRGAKEEARKLSEQALNTLGRELPAEHPLVRRARALRERAGG